MDNIILNKSASIERAIRRMAEEYQNISSPHDYTHIDALVLNIERACQACIDIAMHLCARDHLGIPQNSLQAFLLLHEKERIDAQTLQKMKGMIGFRNIAVHEYQELNREIVLWIAATGWRDFTAFLTQLGVSISVPD